MNPLGGHGLEETRSKIKRESSKIYENNTEIKKKEERVIKFCSFKFKINRDEKMNVKGRHFYIFVFP